MLEESHVPMITTSPPSNSASPPQHLPRHEAPPRRKRPGVSPSSPEPMASGSARGRESKWLRFENGQENHITNKLVPAFLPVPCADAIVSIYRAEYKAVKDESRLALHRAVRTTPCHGKPRAHLTLATTAYLSRLGTRTSRFSIVSCTSPGSSPGVPRGPKRALSFLSSRLPRSHPLTRCGNTTPPTRLEVLATKVQMQNYRPSMPSITWSISIMSSISASTFRASRSALASAAASNVFIKSNPRLGRDGACVSRSSPFCAP